MIIWHWCAILGCTSRTHVEYQCVMRGTQLSLVKCACEKGTKGLNMKKILLTVAAISGLAFAIPSLASPLANGLGIAKNAIPTANEGFVQKVNGWHCRRKYGKRSGWHRHRRACSDYDDYGYYGSPSYGYGLGVPFFSFGFSDFDNGRRHHRFRRHGGKKNWD